MIVPVVFIFIMPISTRHGFIVLRPSALGLLVEEVERQQFRDVSDLQAVGDRSIAVVLASPGWQDFYLIVNVPAFFNTIGQQQTFGLIDTEE